ncbi:MAG TPA: hypothetical protein VHA75_08080 [Rugosimonospora sp.]|nr:hypothetical protein [Rugosimonospora sp.]
MTAHGQIVRGVVAGDAPPAGLACPAAWCTADHSRPDPEGEYHHGTLAELSATDIDVHMGREYRRTLYVLLDRLDGDEDDPRPGSPSVCVDTDPPGPHTCVSMTPIEALALAATLVRAAFAAAVELELSALDVRLGDEIATPDGWEVVESVLINTVGPRVEFFTMEKYGSDEGYRYAPDAPVRVRREVAR